MKTSKFLVIAAVSALTFSSAHAQVPFTATCTNSGLGAGMIGQKTVGGQTVFVRRLATIFDAAMDDFGTGGSGDRLELFCVSSADNSSLGMMAGCLTNENCPWR